MVEAEGKLKVRMLRRQGEGIREIARKTAIARNTVRRHLRDKEATRCRRACAASRARSRPPIRAYYPSASLGNFAELGACLTRRRHSCAGAPRGVAVSDFLDAALTEHAPSDTADRVPLRYG